MLCLLLTGNEVYFSECIYPLEINVDVVEGSLPVCCKVELILVFSDFFLSLDSSSAKFEDVFFILRANRSALFIVLGLLNSILIFLDSHRVSLNGLG